MQQLVTLLCANLQANNKYQEVFTSSIDELDRRILMQGVSYE